MALGQIHEHLPAGHVGDPRPGLEIGRALHVVAFFPEQGLHRVIVGHEQLHPPGLRVGPQVHAEAAALHPLVHPVLAAWPEPGGKIAVEEVPVIDAPGPEGGLAEEGLARLLHAGEPGGTGAVQAPHLEGIAIAGEDRGLVERLGVGGGCPRARDRRACGGTALTGGAPGKDDLEGRRPRSGPSRHPVPRGGRSDRALDPGLKPMTARAPGSPRSRISTGRSGTVPGHLVVAARDPRLVAGLGRGPAGGTCRKGGTVTGTRSP